MDITGLSACLLVNPITFYSYDFLWNYTVLGRASDLMMALALSFHRWVGTFVCFDSLRPSQQSFSYAGTGLPGLNQY